jgi:hypothetical protein
MSDGIPAESNEEQPQAEEGTASDWREDRREARQRRRAGRSGGAWIGGAVLILIGLVLLLGSLGVTSTFLEHWWALFILIPAFGAFAGAYRSRRDTGRFTGAAVGGLIGGVMLTLVALTFLFGLSWNLMGPVLLIGLGVGGLLTAFGARRSS